MATDRNRERLRGALPNARDLHEAFPAIPPGRLIRCANPSSTAPEHLEFLLGEMRVRDLIDLRAGEEMAEDDPGSALMARAAVREYRRGWLRPRQLYVQPDRPHQPADANGTAAASQSTEPSSSGDATATATTASASVNGGSDSSDGATSAGGGSTGTAAAEAPSSSSFPTPPAADEWQSTGNGASASPAAAGPSSTPLVRHHVSLLDRRRYYLCLAGRLPRRTTASALLTNLVSPARARALLLPYVNGGGLRLLYEMLLESSGPEFCQVMDVLLRAAEARHAVMFFCRAGKDRTGLVAAAVLSVAGASEEEIVADYSRSDAYHRVALAGLERREELAGLDRAQFERAPPEVMRATLEHVRSRYGSFSDYLTSVGFGPDKQQRLRELLTAEW